MLDTLITYVTTGACTLAGFTVLFYLHHMYLKTGKIVKKVVDGKEFNVISGDRIFDIIHAEIYKDECYFKYGVTLKGVEKPFVIDAGANVGLFSRWIAESFPTATVHAAEPVPQLHQCATANCEAHKDRVHIHKVGLSDKPGSASFTYMPTTTGGSTMFEGDLLSPLKKYPSRMVASAIVIDLKLSTGPITSKMLSALAALLQTPVVGDVALYTVFVPLFLFFASYRGCCTEKKQLIDCKLVTLDDMIENLGNTPLSTIPKIDLLKVDVEAAEYAVILGGSDALWDKVQQTVIEVTNVDNRIEKIKVFLAEKGFKNVHVDSEQWEIHKYLDISTIFATRK